MSNTHQLHPLQLSPGSNSPHTTLPSFNLQHLDQQHHHSLPAMTPTFSPSAPQPNRGHQHSHSQSQPQQQQSAPIENLQYSQHQDQTTLVFGVLNYLERLEHEINDMRDFVNLGFRQLDSMGEHDGGMAVRIENSRLQARNWNRTNITELDEPFKTLPTSNGEFPNDIPTTGSILRDSPHKVIDHILDLYDIPFIPMMFLAEKKMLYLRFVGANRVIMHRILD